MRNNQNAELFKAALEESPSRSSSTLVFPRILELFGSVANENALDFGCGSGRFVRAMYDHGATVTAFDSAPKQILLARDANGSREICYAETIFDLLENTFDSWFRI